MPLLLLAAGRPEHLNPDLTNPLSSFHPTLPNTQGNPLLLNLQSGAQAFSPCSGRATAPALYFSQPAGPALPSRS